MTPVVEPAVHYGAGQWRWPQ